MWWGRRDALCRISAAALWPGGEAVGGAVSELTVSGGPKNAKRERESVNPYRKPWKPRGWYGKQKEPTFGRNLYGKW